MLDPHWRPKTHYVPAALGAGSSEPPQCEPVSSPLCSADREFAPHFVTLLTPQYPLPFSAVEVLQYTCQLTGATELATLACAYNRPV